LQPTLINFQTECATCIGAHFSGHYDQSLLQEIAILARTLDLEQPFSNFLIHDDYESTNELFFGDTTANLATLSEATAILNEESLTSDTSLEPELEDFEGVEADQAMTARATNPLTPDDADHTPTSATTPKTAPTTANTPTPTTQTTPNPNIRGITNRGNTCHLNAPLQMLRSVALQPLGQQPSLLAPILQNQSLGCQTAGELTIAFKTACPQLGDGFEAADESLALILEDCQLDDNLSYQVQTTTTLSCRDCGNSRVRDNGTTVPFLDVGLQVSDGQSLQLEAAIEAYATTTLESACSECGDLEAQQCGEEQLLQAQLPLTHSAADKCTGCPRCAGRLHDSRLTMACGDVCIIALKRGTLDMNYNDVKVDVPLEIKLNHGSLGITSYRRCGGVFYRHPGHYVAMNGSLACDDSSVSKANYWSDAGNLVTIVAFKESSQAPAVSAITFKAPTQRIPPHLLRRRKQTASQSQRVQPRHGLFVARTRPPPQYELDMRAMMTRYYHKRTSNMATTLLKSWNEEHSAYQLDKAALDRHFNFYADRIRQTLTLAPRQAEISAIRHRLTGNANPIGDVPAVRTNTLDQAAEPVRSTIQRPTAPQVQRKIQKHNCCKHCGYYLWTPWHNGRSKLCTMRQLRLAQGLEYSIVLGAYFASNPTHWKALSMHKRRSVAKGLKELNLISTFKSFFATRSLSSLGFEG